MPLPPTCARPPHSVDESPVFPDFQRSLHSSHGSLSHPPWRARWSETKDMSSPSLHFPPHPMRNIEYPPATHPLPTILSVGHLLFFVLA